MQDIRKSKTSVRQLLRNPSGRVTLAFAFIVIAGLVGLFVLAEGGTIKENYDNRPKLIVAEPPAPAYRWTETLALDFFREYATARPAPSDQVLALGVETCLDYAVSRSTGDLVPFHMGTSVRSVVAPLAAIPPRWGLSAGDVTWQFWENTRSVVGPC